MKVTLPENHVRAKTFAQIKPGQVFRYWNNYYVCIENIIESSGAILNAISLSDGKAKHCDSDIIVYLNDNARLIVDF